LARALKKALADERPLWDNGIRKKFDMFIDDYLKSDWYKKFVYFL
jgi:hypothetical protein